MYRLISSTKRALSSSGQKLANAGDASCCYKPLLYCDTLAFSGFSIKISDIPTSGTYFNVGGGASKFVIGGPATPCPSGTILTGADLNREQCCSGCNQCGCGCLCDGISSINVTLSATPWATFGACTNRCYPGSVTHLDYIITLFNVNGTYTLTPVPGHSCWFQANISGAISITTYSTSNLSCGGGTDTFNILNLFLQTNALGNNHFVVAVLNASGIPFAGNSELVGNQSATCILGSTMTSLTNGCEFAPGASAYFEMGP